VKLLQAGPDDNGNFWFYGGEDTYSYLDDLWQYDPSINQWAWMWGGGFTILPDYGTLGVFSPTNSPGARIVYSSWKDLPGKFYLLGGTLNAFNGPHYADLWAFDPSINQWAWVSGSNLPFAQSVADSLCVESENYFPGARFENRTAATGIDGNFLLFGGLRFHYPDSSLNDLWSYNPVANTWELISGSLFTNTGSVYGTMGVPCNHQSTFRENRRGIMGQPLMEITGSSGELKTDRKNGLAFKNDLWKFTFQPCYSPYFFASDIEVCEKFCIDFIDISTNNPVSWQWIFQGGDPGISFDQNPVNICFDNPGNYDVTLITTNAGWQRYHYTAGLHYC
jgi:hypothetical protein